MTMHTKIVIGLVLAVAIAAALFGCARPQPYGEDLWIGLREMKQ